MDEVTTLPGLGGIRLDEVVEVMAAEKEERKAGTRDRRICMCGHPVARHKAVREVTVCQPSRMVCRCRDMVPALEVQDTRLFLRKTTGSGAEHALVKGLASCVLGGSGVEWLIETVCSRCGNGDGVVPVGLVRAGDGVKEVGEDASPEATRLLCERCRRELS